MKSPYQYSFTVLFLATLLLAESAHCLSFRNPFNNNRVKVRAEDVVRGGAAVATGGLSEIEIRRKEKEAKKKAERQRREAERQIREQEIKAKRQAYESQIASDQSELASLQELEKQTNDAVGRLMAINQVVAEEVTRRQSFVGGVSSVYNRYFGDNQAYKEALADLVASILSSEKISGAVENQSLTQDPLDVVTKEVAEYLGELDERAYAIVAESINQATSSEVVTLEQATHSAYQMLTKFYQLVLSQRVDAEARIANLQAQLSQL